MDARRFVIGTLVGGVTVLATGTLIFAMAPFRDFLAYAMNAGSATGVVREPQLLWAVALGALSYSALVTLAIGSHARSLNIGAGIKIGAVVGFLLCNRPWQDRLSRPRTNALSANTAGEKTSSGE